MKTTILMVCGVTAALAMAGCVEANPVQHRPVQSTAPVYNSGYNNAYDGYYDGYYGPHAGGYWAQDGYFYYMDANRNYRRDDNRHYRREAFKGGVPFRSADRNQDYGRRDSDNRYDQNRNASYDGYYDGHYGPHIGGYWAQDGYYYYLDANRKYRRDDNRHYRREAFKGGVAFRSADRNQDYGRRDNDNRYDQNRNASYDGYYDGHYGPHIGGYWAQDGYYYYLGSDRKYHRDDKRHYRREAFKGATPFRSADRRTDNSGWYEQNPSSKR